MGTYDVALIGAGARCLAYAGPFAQSKEIRIAGIADPNSRQRRLLKKESGLPEETPEYDDWRDLLAECAHLSGAVVCTPTHLHVEQAVACFERGIPIALEKPVAQNKGECERLLHAERVNHGRSLIGFVLRSTPYFARIHEIVASGRLGRILSVQADELPGWFVSSVMFRSPWRRHHAISGGAMLEKSCHDMDVLNWLIGSRPVALNSFGDRLVFNANPSLPESCPECGVREHCKYYQDPGITHEKGEGILAFEREELRCIYNIDKDVMDTQSVSLVYENGAVANFMLTFHTAGPRAGRNIHMVGTKGRLWGNMELHELSVFDNQSETVESLTVTTNGTGHGGGDTRHAMLLKRMMEDPAFRPDQDAAAGYLSAVMCFAADQSVAERRQIVFRYRDDGYIDLV